MCMYLRGARFFRRYFVVHLAPKHIKINKTPNHKPEHQQTLGCFITQFIPIHPF